MLVDAVIFDCDGTLVDSVPLMTEVLVEYLADLGVTISKHDAVVRFGGGRLSHAIRDFEEHIGRQLPDDFETHLRRRRHDAIRTRLRPIDGALDLLRRTRLPIAVASNGPLEQTRLSLEVTGLLSYFSGNVFSAHDIGVWKPDPGILLHAANVLGIEPSRCAVVEDAAVGIEAGIAAGMTVFALCDTNHWSSERVRAVSSLSDVGRLLNGVG